MSFDEIYWTSYAALGIAVGLLARKNKSLTASLPEEFRWIIAPMVALIWPLFLYALISSSLAQLRDDLRKQAAVRCEERWYDRFL
ncbi:hypothetical protein [Variovorax sp.]|uniref:hypothetical protein n=1 Tax=Variovorax sp. TaxID=1871043 RepID=UPI003BA8E70D